MDTDNLYVSVANGPVKAFENTPSAEYLTRGSKGFYGSLDWQALLRLPEEQRVLRLDTLPPIESFFPGMEERKIVFEPDDREKSDPVIPPYRMVCRLVIKDADGRRGYGTGFFISRRCVITCGHCVYVKSSYSRKYQWAEEVEVIPAANGRLAPFGKQTSSTFRTVEGWVVDQNCDCDFGAVILQDDTLFDRIQSFFGFDLYREERFLEISGYPTKKNGEQWNARGVAEGSDDFKVFYKIDTERGNSGSPVFVTDVDGAMALGVHSFGGRNGDPNHGLKVNIHVLNRWLEWSKL